MSSIPYAPEIAAHAPHGHAAGFFSTYVFSRDHKIIGMQFLFSTLIWFLVGGLLALGIRWQLAYPWRPMPILGNIVGQAEGGQIAPETYTMLVTMHASVMIFFVIIPVLAGAFGNFLIPLMIGAEDMAFPTLNMLSYWFMWPAFLLIGQQFLRRRRGRAGRLDRLSAAVGHAGRCAWQPHGADAVAGGSDHGRRFVDDGLGELSDDHHPDARPGMTVFRMPMTIWAMFITAILQAFALPVLTAALFMQLLDRLIGTGFFLAEGTVANNGVLQAGGGQPLLWQHLFWFYSHPAVYIMILPAMGMVSDIISCFSRKPLFGYKPMVYAIAGIAGLGFIVWGHHMFVSGMNPALGMTFMVSTMLIALPSAIKVFNWLGTMWGGNMQFHTPMLFAVAFVSMFIIGGLSGIFMAATPVDIFIHDTYFIVAHFHYVLFSGTAMGVFGAIYFWFPKMFGRMMNDSWGKIHFFFTFVLLNCVFYPMHILGMRGFPRRLADPYHYETFRNLLPLNQFISWCAFLLVGVQIIFFINFFWSIFFGPRCRPESLAR